MRVMSPGLWKLLRLRIKGRVRRMTRELKTPRGAAFFIVGIAVFTLWFLPLFAQVFFRPEADPERLRQWFPLALLVLTVFGMISSAGERALYFNPSEVEYLFSGPFSRRELLVYKVLSTMHGILLTSFIFSIVMLRFAPWFSGAFLGAFFSMLFVSLLGMTLTLAGEVLAERFYIWGKRFLIIALLAAVGIAIWQAAGLSATDDPLAVAANMRDHPLVAAIVAPLRPFALLVTADSWRALLGWGFAAAGTNLLLFAIIVALDADYNERAIAISEKYYARMQRVQKGGVLTASRNAGRLRLPMLPRWGGIGPQAWRQLTGALRVYRVMLMMLAVLVFIIALFVFVVFDGDDSPVMVWSIVGGLTLWETFFFANALRFDFRNDVDQMDLLKSLPVAPGAMAVGQLVAPVVATTFTQAILLALGAVFVGPPYIALAIFVFLLPINALLYAIENLVFLLYPMRMMGKGPGDFEFLGRHIVVMLLKMAVLLAGAGIAGSLGGLIYLLLGPQWWVIGAVTWVVCAVEVAIIVPLIAGAYRRFDPSVHTPA